MNEQERQVISDVFQRLEQVANQPRDPEAERLIEQKVQRQPYAPYAMAQAIVVQEQALTNLHQQMQAVQEELEELRSRPQQSGGFLSNLFGGAPPRESEPRPMGAPHGQPQPGMGGGGGPWGGSGRGGMGQPEAGQGGPMGQQRQGGGFLGTALATAAGVGGGMLLGNALSSAFSGGDKGGLGALGGGASQANAGGDNSDLSPFGGSGDNASYQDASHANDEDFGAGDDMGGDDWA